MALSLKEVIYLLFVRRVLPNMIFRNRGTYILDAPKGGFIGGDLFQLKTSGDSLDYEEAKLLMRYSCSHITSPENIGGVCQICGGLTCNREDCLAFDPLSQVYCCKGCYSLERGDIPVSIYTKETNLFWKWDLRRYLRNVERKRLPQ